LNIIYGFLYEQYPQPYDTDNTARAALIIAGANNYARHEQFYRRSNCSAMVFISDMQIVVQGRDAFLDCKDTTATEGYFANGSALWQ
jgi:hypothetical protein